MKQISGRQFDYACADGEQISVSVEAVNTAHMVVFNLDGASGVLRPVADLSFTANAKTDGSPILLDLLFNFSGPAGSFEVEVSGDAGGDVSRFVVRPNGLSVTRTLRFLPGDTTIPPP